MHYPGDFVRRAAANMSNTVSSVATTVSNRRNSTDHRRRNGGAIDAIGEESVLMNLKDKYHMQLKCTANKDAVTTTKFALKSGYLMKKNEQGIYQRRYVCTVPHTFMYYFDSDTSEAPRGIIDLELLTQITNEDIELNLSTPLEDKFRTFHFESEEGEDLNDWVLSLMRDRYSIVSEERNAYQQMMSEMSDSATHQRMELEKEKKKVEVELSQCTRLKEEAMGLLRNTLVVIGITEEEMKQLTDMNKLGKAVSAGILKMKSHLDKKYEDAVEALEAEKKARRAERDSLNYEIAAAKEATAAAEARLLKEHSDCELRVRECVCQMDTTNLHLQMAVNAKSAAEGKAQALAEQKRVLVKEVKQLRRRLQESAAKAEQLQQLNEQLCVAAVALQDQLSSGILNSLGLTAAEEEPAEKEAEEEVQVIEEQPQGSGVSAAAAALHQALLLNSRALYSQPSEADPEDGGSAPHSRSESLDGSTRLLPLSASNDDRDPSSGEASPLDPTRPTNWQRLSFSQPQSALKGQRRGLLADSLEADDPETPQASSSSFLNGALSLLSTPTATITAVTATDLTDRSPPPASPSATSSFGRLSSMMFSSSSSSSQAGGSKDKDYKRSMSISGDPQRQDSEELGGRLPSAMRLTCLRCNGTVEGPKYSTCRCKMPALTPQELGPSQVLISSVAGGMTSVAGGVTSVAGGVLSTGSYVAGGIAGGLFKATAATSHTVGGLFSSSTAYATSVTVGSPDTHTVSNAAAVDRGNGHTVEGDPAHNLAGSIELGTDSLLIPTTVFQDD